MPIALAAISFLTGPVGRWLAAAVGILAIAGTLYLRGEHHAYQADAAARAVATVETLRKQSAAGVVYDSDGMDKRLRNGTY